jgi:hypothetical protein
VPSELPELSVSLSQGRSRSRFAVAEAVPTGQRVLYFLEHENDASELAAELRQRGVRAKPFVPGPPSDLKTHGRPARRAALGLAPACWPWLPEADQKHELSLPAPVPAN